MMMDVLDVAFTFQKKIWCISTCDVLFGVQKSTAVAKKKWVDFIPCKLKQPTLSHDPIRWGEEIPLISWVIGGFFDLQPSIVIRRLCDPKGEA